jgi:hypothetical protein
VKNGSGRLVWCYAGRRRETDERSLSMADENEREDDDGQADAVTAFAASYTLGSKVDDVAEALDRIADLLANLDFAVGSIARSLDRVAEAIRDRGK